MKILLMNECREMCFWSVQWAKLCVARRHSKNTDHTEAGGATAPGFNNSQPTIIINNHLDWNPVKTVMWAGLNQQEYSDTWPLNL